VLPLPLHPFCDRRQRLFVYWEKNIHISAATAKTNKHYKNDIAPGGNKARRAAPENSSGCYSVTLNNINC